jgi:hypothetical protein
MTAQHTPEPWEWREYVYKDGLMGYQIFAKFGATDSALVCEIRPGEFPAFVWADNFRRIVAAVNACKGIPTEALEDGVISELVERLRYLDGEEFNNSFLLDVLKGVE